MTGTSWRDKIKVHPAADMFPMMPDDELGALADDIAKNGLIAPIIWFRNELVDGRNRVAAVSRIPDEKRRDEIVAAWRNGKHCIILPWLPDPYGYVVSANIHRRHLTAEQRRELIAKLVKAQPEKSDRQIAATVKASDKTVGAVRAELEARAEIPHVSTRTDTKGRAQPATKPKAAPSTEPSPAYLRALTEQKQRSAEIMGSSRTTPTIAIGAPKARTSRGRKAEARLRARAKIGFAALLHEELADTLDELVRWLRNERTQIAEKIPMQKRVALARGHMMTLGVSLEDLRPVGLTAAPTEPMLAKRQPDKRDLNERIVATLRATPGMTRPALYAKARAYGWQIDEAVETGLIVERDGALFAGGAA